MAAPRKSRTKNLPPCRHCHVRRANRFRGLCWSCYENRGIRRRYAPLGIHGAYGARVLTADTMSATPLPAEPTRALPGSKEKIRVMRDRLRARTSLFHPDDARHDEDALARLDGELGLRALTSLLRLMDDLS